MTSLHEPLSLGSLSLPHRLLMAPVKTAMNRPGGRTTDAAAAYYTRLGRGGVALISMEPAAVAPDGAEHPFQVRLHDDAHVAEVRRLVDGVHAGGALAMVHLNHAGRAANPKVIGGAPVAPSAVPCPTSGATPTVLDEAHILDLIDAFAHAARRAREAGADALEVQTGHGYLVAQFLSPRTNHRDDGWGGSPEARLRFAREVLTRVVAVGLPVVIRVSASEYVPDGLGPADLTPLLDLAAELGVVAVHAGNGSACDTPPWYYSHMSMPLAPQRQALEALRGLTSLPLIAAGRMGIAGRAEELLAAGVADAVALGRPLIADPDLPRKLLDGRSDEVLRCGGCLQSCLVHVKTKSPIRCLVNDWLGAAPAAPAVQRVLVIGGGPAGMGAAIAAGEAGHDVHLYESNDTLGGQLELAVRAPGKDLMRLVLDGLIGRVERSAVQVHTGTPATAALVRAVSPDHVVVATGSVHARPPIPGLAESTVHTASEVFTGAAVGERVLVVGAGMIGMEVSEYLVRNGHEVVAVELLDELPQHVDPMGSTLSRKRLGAAERFSLHLGTRVEEISSDGLRLRRGDEELTTAPVDTVVLAAGMRGDTGLAESLRGLGPQVHVIGDATGASKVEDAWDAGRALGSQLR